MSTNRIKGENGVIIDSTKYLELPKGTDAGRPSKARPGMIRYNSEERHRGIEASVIVETSGTRSLEWRRVAHLDQDGKLLTSQLPSSITGALSYKGTWDADINDVNETAADTSLTDRLPTAIGRTGHYYIVRTDGDGGAAKGHPAVNLGAVPADVIPRYKKGDWIVSNGAEWEKVDQSQITSTASQVQLSTGSMRDKHRVKSAISLQDMLDKFVESALDRTGDIITGTIDVSNLAVDAGRARIRLADGSAALPNLAFVSDNTTGLYKARANAIGFSTNATMRLELDNTTLTSAVTVRNIDGSAGTPSYSFRTSTTSGMYRADPDVIGFSTSGTERVRIYDRGIQSLAVITDKNDATKTAYGFVGDINTGLYSPSTGQVAIATSGSTPATFRSTEIITTVPVRTSNGTVSAPSHSFSGDTKTGLFLSKTGFLNLSAFGKDAMELSNEVITAKETMRFVDGAAATPSISFTADTDTGFIRSADNTIDVITGGTSVMTFGASSVTLKGPSYITDGAVGAPGLAFDTDKDTGIYKSAAKTLSLAAGGKLGLSIDSAQKVTLASVLTAPLGSAALPSIIFNNQTSGLFASTNKVGIATGATERLSVDNTAVKVTNKFIVPNGTAALPSIVFGTNTNSGVYAPADGQVGISAGGTENLVFTADANLSKVQLRIPAGSATAPGIAFDGDINTGFYRKGAADAEDNVTFTANGADIFQVTPTYTNPLTSVKLIDGTLAAPGLCFDSNTKTGLHLASGNINVGISGSQKLSISSTTVTVSGALAISTNQFSMGKGTIQTDSTGTMALKAEHATAPFTFGKGTDIFTTIAPGGIIVPIGTSAQRPATPTNGTIRYNSDIANLEGYTNGAWAELAGSGKITDSGTAGAPAITVGGSSNTGIFSDTANTISISAGGIKVAEFGASGTVFSKPIEINTGTGNVKIGSNNSSWIHFVGDKTFHFNKQVQAEGGFKVFNKDTQLQSDGKIKEDGKLLEDKYVQMSAPATAAAYAPGTKNIEVEKDSSIYWYNATDFAKIMFEHSGVDTGTDNHMLFETGDNDNEYFKFAHRLSGATANTEWMNIKKAGIAVSGKTSTIGDWTMTATGLQFKGSNIISIDTSGNATITGSVTGSSGSAPTGFGLGVGAPPSAGNANTLKESGWRTYNADGASSDTNGATQYGLILDCANKNNASTYTGWAHQLFFASSGAIYSRTNTAVGSFTGSAWNRLYTTLNPPTAAELHVVPETRTVNGLALSANITLNAGHVGALPIGGGTVTGNLGVNGVLSSASSISTGGNITAATFSSTGVANFAGRTNANGGLTVVGTATISNGLSVTGTITSSGAITSTGGDVTAFSDARLKKDVVPLTGALDAVMKLRSVKYVMKADKLEKVKCGFIAQEVREVIPEIVLEHDDEDKTLSVDYSKITAYLVEAMQEQQRLIEELRSEIEILKAK